jgi:hypothetical protein
MASFKDTALAFLDGFSPIDGLFGRIERPSAYENLIDENYSEPASEIGLNATSHE